MGRQRSFQWYDSSEVFSDTRRVDLFNDPPWETPSPPSARATTLEARPASWRATVKAAVAGRIFTKRGQHSHKLA
jgi:hypothetical protein